MSLSVSSLRAYGLGEDILDEMAQMRITGLTFAPEAGTQRMRDVVNKNVTEAHMVETAERVFSRGWNRMKLYFMIGLPTEEDDDVLGIVETGQRMLEIGRRHVGKRRRGHGLGLVARAQAAHAVSVVRAGLASTTSPRKQDALARTRCASAGSSSSTTTAGISFVEGVLARGDRRLGDVIERGVAARRALRRLGRAVRSRRCGRRRFAAGRHRRRGLPRAPGR